MFNRPQSPAVLVGAALERARAAGASSSVTDIPDVLVVIISGFLLPEEMVRFSLISKENNRKINSLSLQGYWEKQLVELGVKADLISVAKRIYKNKPDWNCRRWYSAWKNLLFFAPFDARFPKDIEIYSEEGRRFFFANSREIGVYPVLERPPAYQLMLGGIFPMQAAQEAKDQINFSYWSHHDTCDKKRDRGANILHYAAWSGSFNVLMKALKYFDVMIWSYLARLNEGEEERESLSSILFCAKTSGAVKTVQQQLAVLSFFYPPISKLPSAVAEKISDRPILALSYISHYFSASSGTNLLHDAAREGQIEILNFFEKVPHVLQSGKIVECWNIRSKEGANVWHYAALHAAKSGSLKVLQCLTQLPAKHIDNNGKDKDGQAPSDWAEKAIMEAQQEIDKKIDQKRKMKIQNSLLIANCGPSAPLSFALTAYSLAFFNFPKAREKKVALKEQQNAITAFLRQNI